MDSPWEGSAVWRIAAWFATAVVVVCTGYWALGLAGLVLVMSGATDPVMYAFLGIHGAAAAVAAVVAPVHLVLVCLGRSGRLRRVLGRVLGWAVVLFLVGCGVTAFVVAPIIGPA
ncbi:hypothetical protein [Nocardiopsis lucentensis]|uniref:hypothetical protein n=1 Tax=Nocardiopsis lucentensis TaxID=53441 RepID=UPI00034833FE|nr:hypothetical protein [Nocardiopsis lucentensis]